MKDLYVTVFDKVTKKCAGASTKLPTTDRVEAEKMLGRGKEPALRTKNMSIYHTSDDKTSMCLSWIRFAL